MSGRASRRKGANGELEVAKILAAHGFNARRTPNSGGLHIKGDLTGADGGAAIPGYHLEVKRAEALRIPDWLAQTHADAGANVPVLVFRRNARGVDPCGHWHAVLPLEALLALLTEDAAIFLLNRALRAAGLLPKRNAE